MLTENRDARANLPPLFGIWAILAAAIVAVFTVRLIAYADMFPYFFMFDMDRLALTDYLRVRNAEIPNQLHHPSFGLYALFRLTEAVWRLVEQVPSYAFPALADSLSPVFVVAELASFLRAHSPYIAILSTVSMALAVGLGCNAGPAGYAALLLVGLSCPWLIYQGAMIRSELFGVFYWAAGLLSLALAARSRAFGPVTAWLSVAGAFFGLSFLSKTQVFVLIVLGPIFYFHALWFQSQVSGREIWLRPSRPMTLTAGAGAFALGLALVLFAVAPSFPIPEGAFILRYQELGPVTYGLSRQFAVFCLLAAGAIGLALAPASVWRKFANLENPSIHIAHMVAILAAGFMGIALVHLVLGPDLAKNAEHMAIDFKVTMLRVESFRLRSADDALAVAAILFADQPGPMTLYAGSVVAAFATALIAKPRHWGALVALILGSAAILIFQLVHAVRPEPKDWIFHDAGFFVFGAANLFIVGTVLKPWRAATVALALIAVVAAIDNLRAGAILKDYLSVNYQLYGWRKLQFFDFGWPDQTEGFFSIGDMIVERYGKVDQGRAGSIVDHANRHKKILHDARFVIGNQTVTGARIGMAAPAQGVWANDRQRRVVRLPEFMEGATVVDIPAGSIDPRMPKWKPVRHDRMRIQQLDKGVVGENLALLARSDLGVYLFVPEAKLADLGPVGGASTTDHVIQLAAPGGPPLPFRGIRVDAYALFPWARLGQSFLVITDDSRDRTTVR